MINYQDNFHAKGDVLFVIYFHFETTAPTDNCLDPEQKKVFVVSYVMIVAFNPELNLVRIIIQRSLANWAINKFRLFHSRIDYLYSSKFDKNVKRHGFWSF